MSNLLVVGAGLFGSVVARELAQAGYKVHVIDKRDHIAGNCFDYIDENGIRVHKYGPHLFHTNNKTVFEWLSKYTEWVPYQHRVKAQLDDGRFVTLPVNKETTEIVGKDNIIDVFFRPYTKKMWGKEIEELNPDIINRVPIRDDLNDLYFPNDAFQAMPKEGYTKMIENILDHPNITVELNKSFDKNMEDQWDHIFNSMPIDEYFNYCFGELPYRSIKFHHINLPMTKVLPSATVNFTHDGPYTRVTEWKQIPEHGENHRMTTLTYEEPCDYRDNNMERYYPIKDVDGENQKAYQRYKGMTPDNMTFIGRTGLYVYLDMHQVVSSALFTVRSYLK